ncbi:hypothetical protein [Nonomuraea recticatena]
MFLINIVLGGLAIGLAVRLLPTTTATVASPSTASAQVSWRARCSACSTA